MVIIFENYAINIFNISMVARIAKSTNFFACVCTRISLATLLDTDQVS